MKQKKTTETLKEEDREKIAKLVKSGFIFTAKARVCGHCDCSCD